MLKVLHETFGVAGGLMTTIHAFTRDQELLDGTNQGPAPGPSRDAQHDPDQERRGPGIDKVTPELAGRIVGIAVRVPVPDVSLVDLTVTLERVATVEQVNEAFRQASSSWQTGVIDVTDEPLVSGDSQGDSHSAVIDLVSTRGGPGRQVKVLAWYDNEADYSARVVELCRLLGGAAA